MAGTNGTKSRLAVHDEQIKQLAKSISEVNLRFNHEIGNIDLKVDEITDILKGKGGKIGLIAKVDYLFEKSKNDAKTMALWISTVIAVTTVVSNIVLRILGM